ncbi:MAG TPA: Ig-like domain-containing protein [Planctomycetaceae bacterium]|nr:Ig-like domain-containing protein [Planctomycetaceae bacterium]
MPLGDWLLGLRRGFVRSHRAPKLRVRRRAVNTVPAAVQGLEPRRMLSGTSLYVSHGGTMTFTPTEGDLSTFSVDTAPTHGTVTQGPNGSWTYDPDDSYVGEDNFALVGIEQTSGGPMPSQPYEVDVTVYNMAPSGNADHYGAVVGHPITLKVVGNDNDPDGDSMTIEIVDDVHALVNEYQNPNAPPPPSPGSLSDNGNGSVTFTPADDFLGTAVFTYRPKDSLGAIDLYSDPVTVTIGVFDPAGVADTTLGGITSGGGGLTSWTGSTSLPLTDSSVEAAAQALAAAQSGAAVTWSATEGSAWGQYEQALAADDQQRNDDLTTSSNTYNGDRESATSTYVDDSFSVAGDYIDDVSQANSAFSTALSTLNPGNGGSPNSPEPPAPPDPEQIPWSDVANVIEGLQPAYDSAVATILEGAQALSLERVVATSEYRSALRSAATGYMSSAISAEVTFFVESFGRQIEYLQDLLTAAETFQDATAQADDTHVAAVNGAQDAYRNELAAAVQTFEDTANASLDSARDDVRSAFADYLQAEARFDEGTSDSLAWRQAQKDLAVALAQVNEARSIEGGNALVQLVSSEQQAMVELVRSLAEADREYALNLADAQQAHDDAIVTAIQSDADAKSNATAAHDGSLISANSTLEMSVETANFNAAAQIAAANQGYGATWMQASGSFQAALAGAAEQVYDLMIAPDPQAAAGASLSGLVGAVTARAASLHSARGSLQSGLASADHAFREALQVAATAHAQRSLEATLSSALRRQAASADYQSTMNSADRQYADDSTSADVAYAVAVAQAVQSLNLSAIQDQVTAWQSAAADARQEVEDRPAGYYELPDAAHRPRSASAQRFSVDTSAIAPPAGTNPGSAPAASGSSAAPGEGENPAEDVSNDAGQLIDDLPQLTEDAFNALPDSQQFPLLQQMIANGVPSIAEIQATRAAVQAALSELSPADGAVALELAQPPANPPTTGYTPCIVRYGAGNPFPFIDSPDFQTPAYLGQILLGDWSGVAPSVEGTLGSILFGLTGFDVYKDALDISYGVANWQWTWGDAGTMALNTIALLPLVGVVKQARNADVFFDATSDAAVAAARAADELAAQRNTLRSLLLPPGGNPFQVPAQAHHIFPVDLFDSVLGQRLRSWGINLNGVDNGILLPTRRYAPNQPSIHRGANGEEYVRTVREALAEATNRDEAMQILDDLRQKLQSGQLPINGAE